MPWKKGAVVIVKHGDQDWADSMEESLNIQRASDKELEELENENRNLKRDKDLSKIHDDRFTQNALDDLENKWDYYPPPTWLRVIKEGLAFIVYWISIFFDKFLTIK